MIPYFRLTTIFIGKVPIQVWGIMAAIGFTAALLISRKEAERKNLDKNFTENIVILSTFFGILGSRLFYVLLSTKYYLQHPIEIFFFWKGGLAYFGGIIVSFLFSLIYIKLRKKSFLEYLDVLTPALILAHAFGRIGCFLIHDHLGKLTTFPIAIQWTDGKRFETSLHDFIFEFMMFGLIWKIRKNEKLKHTLFFLYLSLYSVFRFGNDFLRAEDLPHADIRYHGLTAVQLFILILFPTAVMSFFYFFAKYKELRYMPKAVRLWRKRAKNT